MDLLEARGRDGRVLLLDVLWVCSYPGCQARFEVDPKKMRESFL